MGVRSRRACVPPPPAGASFLSPEFRTGLRYLALLRKGAGGEIVFRAISPKARRSKSPGSHRHVATSPISPSVPGELNLWATSPKIPAR